MVSRRSAMIMLGAAATAVLAAARHGGSGRHVAGGIMMKDAARYDLQTRLLMGTFFDGVAADIDARDGDRVLEVGCGPGHLSGRLARRGLVVSGIDLDPAMIERARANAERATYEQGPRPSFVVADVAALPIRAVLLRPGALRRQHGRGPPLCHSAGYGAARLHDRHAGGDPDGGRGPPLPVLRFRDPAQPATPTSRDWRSCGRRWATSTRRNARACLPNGRSSGSGRSPTPGSRPTCQRRRPSYSMRSASASSWRDGSSCPPG